MKYLKLWAQFFRASWMADLEYRVNIVIRSAGEVAWYIVQLSTFEVIYLHTSKINGWDIYAMRVFMATLFLVDNIYMFFFQDGLDSLNQLVRRGDLDMYLTKPVNAQFMVSCRRVSVAYLLNFFVLVPYLVWGVHSLSQPVEGAQIFAYVLAVIAGALTYYALRFLFATLVIVLQDAGNVQFVWHQLFRLATRPERIYPAPLRWIVLTIFPIGFVASVPARMLVESFNPTLALISVVFSLALVSVSHFAWTRALGRYASASS